MKALIIEDFTTKTGKILKIGDVIESEDGGIILRLIEKGRARPLSAEPSGPPACRTCDAFVLDRERGPLGLGFCRNRNHHIWVGDDSICLDFTHRIGPSCPEGEAEQPTTPQSEKTSFPALFSIGQSVQFSHLRALDVREGVIVDSKWHGPVIGRWYRIEAGGLKIWPSESHVQAAPGGSGPLHTEGGQ